jgi:hypothetical protein
MLRSTVAASESEAIQFVDAAGLLRQLRASQRPSASLRAKQTNLVAVALQLSHEQFLLIDFLAELRAR